MSDDLTSLLAQRMATLQPSFIREILKVTANPAVISFAGGLPNPRFFPVAQIAEAAQKVLRDDGAAALQYSTSEGFLPLRQFIARRYRRFGLTVSPDEILITNGSQQGLDLVGKLFIDPGDPVIIEQPGYLGAIQAFSLYRPAWRPLPLEIDGIEPESLARILEEQPVKLFYTVSNFQNPSGRSYSRHKRQAVAELLARHNTLLVEDNPYGELRFSGETLPLISSHIPAQAITLGSFSKIVSPALRLGWLRAPLAVMPKLVAAKQAADLHSNYLAQRIVAQYLQDNNLDEHLAVISAAYGQQCQTMLAEVEAQLPPTVAVVPPDGGMFVWLTLPPDVSALALFEAARRENVAFVPGQPFYVDGGGDNALRLNFSNAGPDDIKVGIQRLAAAFEQLTADS